MEFLKLLKTNQTVWTLREIALILRILPERVRAKVFRWCQKGLLRRIRKGIYVRTDTDYNRLEVAEGYLLLHTSALTQLFFSTI